jgi:hypothetical protein
MTKTMMFLVVITVHLRLENPHWNNEHTVDGVTQLF